jgi:TRAP-type mannitol/chloroaromatic compound transport system permease large subunit
MHPHRKTSLTRTASSRRGYALLTVLVFVVLFVSLLGVAWRNTASALRIASVRSLQIQRDEGSLHALARALHLLETGLPPSNPYVCGVTIDTSRGSRSFTVTFTLVEGTTWSVHTRLTPSGESPQAMPEDFAAEGT